MWGTNRRSAICLGITLCLCKAAAAGEIAPDTARVTVAIHNHVGLPSGVLAEVQRTVKEIFWDAGLSVEAVECEATEDAAAEQACRTPQFPSYLQLTIARSSKSLTDSALGVAYIDTDGTGCFSDVFLDPTEEARQRIPLNLGVLLGHVMAHEIGHLLLGTNAHSSTGIMRAHWSKQDLEKISKHALLFTEAQGRRMRATVEAGLRMREKELVAAKRGLAAE